MNRFQLLSVLLGITLAGSASAGWLSGPSGLQVGEQTAIIGGDFTPDSTLQLDITDPAGNTTTVDVAVAADGSINHPLDLNQSGEYTAEGWDIANTGETPDASAVIVATD